MNNFQNEFSRILKELIVEKGINISKLSKATGIPRTSINNWLYQNRSPGLAYLGTLADYFKCTVDYLLGKEDEFGNKI